MAWGTEVLGWARMASLTAPCLALYPPEPLSPTECILLGLFISWLIIYCQPRTLSAVGAETRSVFLATVSPTLPAPRLPHDGGVGSANIS